MAAEDPHLRNEHLVIPAERYKAHPSPHSKMCDLGCANSATSYLVDAGKDLVITFSKEQGGCCSRSSLHGVLGTALTPPCPSSMNVSGMG